MQKLRKIMKFYQKIWLFQRIFCIITWVGAVSQSALRMGVEFIPEFNGNIA